jgi:hypothetical protein
MALNCKRLLLLVRTSVGAGLLGRMRREGGLMVKRGRSQDPRGLCHGPSLG